MGLDIKTFRSNDGAEIKYVDEGAGIPVLYIYGIGSSMASSEPFINTMKAHCRFLVFDQRSFGITPAVGELGIHQSARDAQALMDHLGLDQVILFGYSMGAAVLFSYLQQFGCGRLKKIIIGDMSPKLINEDGWNLGLYQGHYTREMFNQDLERIKTDYRSVMLILTEQLLFQNTPDTPRDFSGSADEILARIKSRCPNELILQALLTGMVDVSKEHQNSIYYYWETMANADFRDVLKTISVPTGFLYSDPGSGYQPATAEYMQAQVSAPTTMMPMKGCSHMASAEAPAQFRQYLFDYIKD